MPASKQDWLVLPQAHAELGWVQCYVIEAVITCQLVLVYISSTHLHDKESRILSCLAVGMSAAVGTLFAVSSTTSYTTINKIFFHLAAIYFAYRMVQKETAKFSFVI